MQLRVAVPIAAAVCASGLCLVDRSARDSIADSQRSPRRAGVESAESSHGARTAPTSLTRVARNEPEPERGIRDPQLAAVSDPAGHPHPITAEHQQIQRELRLIQALNDAVDLKDAAQMRVLIAAYAREYPDDPNVMRAGYERLADCLEDPGVRTREAARNYYERERASTLRRYVRRICLERDERDARATADSIQN